MTALAAQPDPAAAEATRQLFERHRQRIFGYCLGQLGNRCDAEDAVQTTFLYAFGCLERGVVPEAELAWLFKIALNVCRTRRRTLGRRRRVEAPVDLEACEYALAAPERGDNELLGLSSALAAMPPNQRSALLLREWQGLTYAEIGEKLAISQSAVETLLFRARRTLASQLTRAPQRVAVMLNVPVLLHLLRRLVRNAGAMKTTAAVVAVGAVSTVGGHELAPVGNPAPVPVHAARLAPTRAPAASVSTRRDSTAPASPRRTPRPVRIAAPSTAEAAVSPPAAPRATPPAASAPNAAPSAPPAAAATVTTPAVAPQIPAQISPPAAPALPVEPPAINAGELAGSVVAVATAAVQAVATPVLQVVPDPPKLVPLP
jgi:RNA polymerase sigma-70 factor, ECF subfamily